MARVILGARNVRRSNNATLGWAGLSPHRQVGDASAGAAAKLLLQAMRANQQFDQLGIRPAGHPWPHGRIDDEALALANSAQPCWKRQQQRMVMLQGGR